MSKRRDPNPSPRRRKPAAPRRSTWPIFRAYTPIPDAFRVSGYGTAGIVRVQPNGKLSSAFFMLNLSGSGVDLMFGKDDETPDTVEALLRAGYRDLPPWQEGPADLAARYVWGAHALTQDEVDYPDEARRYLDMLPKFPGRRRQWRVSQMFAMHPPIASEELLIAIDDLVLIHGETPSHQEVAVATFMELEVADLAAVREAIRLRPEDFEQRDSSTPDLFVWIKPRTALPGRACRAWPDRTPGKLRVGSRPDAFDGKPTRDDRERLEQRIEPAHRRRLGRTRRVVDRPAGDANR